MGFKTRTMEKCDDTANKYTRGKGRGIFNYASTGPKCVHPSAPLRALPEPA